MSVLCRVFTACKAVLGEAKSGSELTCFLQQQLKAQIYMVVLC